MSKADSPGRLLQKPNFLLIVVDEERYPPVYESSEIQAWRKKNLITQELLKEHGLEFHRHYIGSSACCPSRATIFTGQYPSLHGVTQTTGIAKQAFDSNMFWLPRNTVPTMGNYFRAAGYQTYYHGKWHFSNEDIIVPGTHDSLPSYNPLTGVPDKAREDLYLHANRLNDYGFSRWIGPEPHGRNPRNSGSSASGEVNGRDIVYAAEVVELIQQLDQAKQANEDQEPWLIIASFVNPHDIVLYGALTAHNPLFHFDVMDMPYINHPPTMYEALDKKPRCQASYRDIYPKALQPIPNDVFYRKLYYQLQKTVDQQMLQVFNALKLSSFYDNTIVIFTSDHGELLGAHGYLHQKFYCAYEEAVHVPFIVHNKQLFQSYQAINKLTSHVDLIPTMLGLANVNITQIQDHLSQSFSEVRPFVGRDLSPLILDHDPIISEHEAIYFMTDDDITQGQHQVNPLGQPFQAVIQPNHIETVIAVLQTNQGEELWKYSHYFDKLYNKSQPSDEYELYNLTLDPLEIHNLAHAALASPQSRLVQQHMSIKLEEQRNLKRLVPLNRPSPLI